MIYRTNSGTRMIAESEYSKLVDERDEARRQLSHCRAANNKHRSERDALAKLARLRDEQLRAAVARIKELEAQP